jgi:predicted NBD/HSP70 family sugar kinase
MNNSFQLIEPQFLPPLDMDFRPAVLANHKFIQQAASVGGPLVIGLEREEGKISRYETVIFPEGHPNWSANLPYVERLVKLLLWQRGGYRVYVGGPHPLGEHIRQAYSSSGSRQFDFHFMGEQVYEKPFEVVICDPDHVPPTREGSQSIGRHLDGSRIGFDLGASDRKVSAVVDGQVVFSEERIWEPSIQFDPQYHYNEILEGLRTAAAKLDHLDAIGGSSAGIFINNRPMVASLFRGIPTERWPEVRSLFARLQKEFGVPLVVINDGDVAALAGAMSIEDNGVLGIALGSSEAGGYVDMHGNILGWLNELSFVPIDYNPHSAVDEWSGDTGCGSHYLSQRYVFRLAPLAGLVVRPDMPDAEKLASLQDKLAAGHAGAEKIWRSMGIYLGYAIAHYADFYEIRHVIILGRCTSGAGGALLLEEANRVLTHEFPFLDSKITVQLPDEKSRRVGQSIAAASLPDLRI